MLISILVDIRLEDNRRQMHYSNTFLLVVLCLLPLISISLGLSSLTDDPNETEKSDHELLVKLEQSLQKMTLELSFLRGEVENLQETNIKLMGEINNCNQSLEIMTEKVEGMASKTCYLTKSVNDLWTKANFMNTNTNAFNFSKLNMPF